MAALTGLEYAHLGTAAGGVISAQEAQSRDIALLAGAIPPRAGIAVTNVTGTTLTAAALVDGVVTRSGPTAAFTDTLDTAANILAALPSTTPTSFSWLLSVRNTTAYAMTVAGGSGSSIAGLSVIPANSAWLALVQYTGPAALAVTGLMVAPTVLGTPEAPNAITTAGAGTLTAAAIAGQLIQRSGPTAVFTDTTDTAANIVAALPNAAVGEAFELTIENNTGYTQTLAAGTGVTLAGQGVVPANSWGRFLLQYTGAGAVTLTGIMTGPNAALPATQYTSISGTSWTAAQIAGAAFVHLATSGATALTTPTAAQLIAAIPNAQVGVSYLLRIYNTNGGTLTLTAGSGVTITGTATIATNVWREYQVVYSGVGAVTWQNLGSGTAN